MKKTLFFLLLSFSSVVSGQSGIQPVYSLTYLGDFKVDGVEVTQVKVKCNIHNELRYISRENGADSWCAYGLDSKCDEDRIAAAAKACLMSEQEVAETKAKPDDKETVAKTAEQIAAQERRASLENELMTIERKRIQIRTRELELRKREVELNKQLGEVADSRGG